jgi:hypothetical protein
MLGAQLAELLDGGLPGVGEALELVAGLDDGLVHGVARLGEGHARAFAALADALVATPLGAPMGEAVEKLAAGSVADTQLTVLAGGRAALLGAVHDALLARLDAALGRTRAAWEQPPAPLPATAPPAADNLLAGCRSWLRELAITGWRGVDHDLVSASAQTLAALLGEPGLRRLAILLDGLAIELRASCPVVTMRRLPVRRWADLWARAMLLSQTGGWPGGPGQRRPVSGRLLVLGVDVHEHATAVQIQVHGVLEPVGGAPARLVRTSVAAAKVDTIVGPALWRLLRRHPVLVGALAEHRSLDVTDRPLLDSGDLVWRDDQARVGEPADPFATARVQLATALARRCRRWTAIRSASPNRCWWKATRRPSPTAARRSPSNWAGTALPSTWIASRAAVRSRRSWWPPPRRAWACSAGMVVGGCSPSRSRPRSSAGRSRCTTGTGRWAPPTPRW